MKKSLFIAILLAASVSFGRSGFFFPGYGWNGGGGGYSWLIDTSDVFDPLTLDPIQMLYSVTTPNVANDATTNSVDAVIVQSVCATTDGVATRMSATDGDWETLNPEVFLFVKFNALPTSIDSILAYGRQDR